MLEEYALVELVLVDPEVLLAVAVGAAAVEHDCCWSRLQWLTIPQRSGRPLPPAGDEHRKAPAL